MCSGDDAIVIVRRNGHTPNVQLPKLRCQNISFQQNWVFFFRFFFSLICEWILPFPLSLPPFPHQLYLDKIPFDNTRRKDQKSYSVGRTKTAPLSSLPQWVSGVLLKILEWNMGNVTNSRIFFFFWQVVAVLCFNSWLKTIFRKWASWIGTMSPL
jgi:hypothetical protein